MGLDIYLDWRGQSEQEHKEQLTGFRNAGEVGYLRSSYNDGGFNSWAGRMIGGKDFYWIFGYSDDAERETGEHYEDGEPKMGFFPNWAECRQRTQQALEDARKLDNHYTVVVRPLMEYAGKSDDALAVYHKVTDPRTGRDNSLGGADWFACREGEFFLTEPPVVKAVIPARGFGGVEIVLVCEMPDGKSPHEYYIGVLESVLKFIDLGEQKNGWLVWSG